MLVCIQWTELCFNVFSVSNKRKKRLLTSYLKVSFGGEGLLANGASERLVAGMSAHVYLQGRARREVLIAHVTQVLTCLQACKHTHNTHKHTRNQLGLVQARIFGICYYILY